MYWFRWHSLWSTSFTEFCAIIQNSYNRRKGTSKNTTEILLSCLFTRVWKASTYTRKLFLDHILIIFHTKDRYSTKVFKKAFNIPKVISEAYTYAHIFNLVRSFAYAGRVSMRKSYVIPNLQIPDILITWNVGYCCLSTNEVDWWFNQLGPVIFRETISSL